jgi:hypothetical protein
MVLGLMGVSLATAPVANAAGECGSGYSYIHGHPMTNASGTRTGTLEIYYKSSNGYNCAIARCYGGTCGVEMWRGVHIKRDSQNTPPCDGTDIRCDVGRFRYYAGPVYVYARSTCIDAYGWFDGANKFGNSWGRGFDFNAHCG